MRAHGTHSHSHTRTLGTSVFRRTRGRQGCVVPLVLTATDRPKRRPRLSVLDALAHKNVTMNNHQQGVTPADFRRSSALTKSFEILATNYDKSGKEFVSLVEVRGHSATASRGLHASGPVQPTRGPAVRPLTPARATTGGRWPPLLGVAVPPGEEHFRAGHGGERSALRGHPPRPLRDRRLSGGVRSGGSEDA